ncbi:hypothetical protein M422DRAFT_272820 [Sphaerobolus stellatus SS14]|uniref:DNA (cytosine-5-)-methyltransferase n=1 Tax=Sphaerobolus stellatus (strain SS14) TaxID=990650 RepID=A0A0C9TAJ8_SPHS4|nr:hypothetical protein M422DRAFT_272820 [Sphaerobolus stellatus SS14]
MLRLPKRWLKGILIYFTPVRLGALFLFVRLFLDLNTQFSQNDSALNRHRGDLKRPSLTALSFVDVLRPDFVVLEFVPGMFRSNVNREDVEDVEEYREHIEAGEMKLVLKILRFLGYNVRGRIVNARTYGTPQSRDRFMIVGTIPEYGPLNWPEPTHAFDKTRPPKGRNIRRLTDHLKFQIDNGTGKALHKVVTVEEALSDLPHFDWETPKPLTNEERESHKRRAEVQHIPTLPCEPDGIWGYEEDVFEYASPPMHRFQRVARKDLPYCDEKRFQHYTKHLPKPQVQNVWDVPFLTDADYRHLPQQRLEFSNRDPAGAKARAGFQGGSYTRLEGKGYFHTITTNVGPLAKQDAILHPHCKRILTVRELARAQGFPDDFAFYSTGDNMQDYLNQIGNSVPFGLSAAIGRAIQDLVFQKWQDEKN